MTLPRPLRSFKAIRKPGKNGPAVFAFSDPRPLLRDFTKNIDAKAKPSLHKPLGSRAEGFAKPMSSEPAPSHRPWIGALGATPACRAIPYHAGYKINLDQQDFLRAASSFLPITIQAGTTTVGCQNACENAQTGGCYRSTKLLIVVPRPSWCNIFLQKTWRQRKAEKDETTKSFEQQPN